MFSFCDVTLINRGLYEWLLGCFYQRDCLLEVTSTLIKNSKYLGHIYFSFLNIHSKALDLFPYFLSVIIRLSYLSHPWTRLTL